MTIDFSKIKGLIFDYGGTLDTNGEHWSEIIWAGWQNAKIDCDKAEFREAYVYAERELARTLHILPQHNFADLLLIKIKIELQYLSEIGHFAPADIDEKAKIVTDYCYNFARKNIEKSKEVLKKLSEKYPMVLVSNFYGNIESVLKNFGMNGLFKKIIESAVVGVRKPDPEIFRMGVKALGCLPEETIVIGDSYKKDIEAAEKAGCNVLWLKGKGWTSEEDEILHPNIIKNLEEILSFID